ncbi:hypothetical protein D3C86_1794950 [compost metagenome]
MVRSFGLFEIRIEALVQDGQSGIANLVVSDVVQNLNEFRFCLSEYRFKLYLE